MVSGTLEFLRQHTAEILEALRLLVESESPSNEKALLDQTAMLVASFLEDAGFAVTTVREAVGGNHVRGYLAGDEGLQPILILAHYDTVWAAGTLKTMPFTIDNGIVRGPGVFDMKTGLVQAVWAIRAARAGNGIRRPVVFLSNSDEEIGSVYSRSLIEEEAQGAALALVFEGSHHGALKTSRKGACLYDIDIVGRAAHAGLDPTAGASAIEELADQIVALRQMADLAAGTTVNVGVVRAGTRPNVVAAEAHAAVDIRVASAAEADRIVMAMSQLRATRDGTSIQIRGGLNRPPMERTPAVVELFRRAQGVARHLGLVLEEASVGGASDGNFCAAQGCPVLDGLGAVGDGAHAANEHVVAETIPVRAALAAELMCTL